MRQGQKNLRLNLICGVLNQLCNMLVNFFTKQAIQNTLGTEYLGIQSVFGNICDVLMFAFAGIGIAMLVRLYRPLEENDYDKLRAVYLYFKKVFERITCLALGVGAACSLIVVWSVHTDVSMWYVLANYWLYLIAVVVYNRFMLLHYYYMADQKRYVGSLVYMLTDVGGMVLQMLSLYLLHNYVLFILSLFLKNVVAAIWLNIYKKENYAYLCDEKKQQTLSVAETAELKSDVKDMIISKMGNVLLYSTDGTIVSGVVSTVMAGIYSNYAFVVLGISMLVTAVFESTMAGIGKDMASEEERSSFAGFRRHCHINTAMTILCVAGFFCLADDFIFVWMGSRELTLAKEVLLVITINLFMGCMRNAASMYRQAAGLFSKVSWVILARGIANIVLSLILGSMMGLIGIPLATTITDLCTVYWYEASMVYRYYEKSFLWELWYQCLGAIFVVAAIWLGKKATATFTVYGWISFFGKTILVTMVAIGVIVIYLTSIWYSRRVWNKKHGNNRS